ncbi:MAG: TatD family hydrolase [Candidatus Levybacteria bacterium]|nr:TatD family hydrolase [Candidatus Levybacteria bacterium]MBP9814771.1 TatD family hydrolase [Candidatus Levybacteria bacterium]
MVDVHCHLNLHKFDQDYDAVIKDAFFSGVTAIVNTGTSIPSSRKAVELASKYKDLYAIVGVHPHHADKTDKEFEGELQYDWLEKLEELAKQPKVIGIGEVGMDFFRYKSNGIVETHLQEDAFRKQIELSIKLGLPLQIHTRLAWDDTLDILLEYKSQLQDPPGMFHCFSGNIEYTKRVLDAGFYVGFDGNITYGGTPPGEDTSLSDLVEYAPLDRILTETDSPFLTPQSLRGTRNVPQNVIIVARHIAHLKGCSYEKVNETVLINFQKVFGRHI